MHFTNFISRSNEFQHKASFFGRVGWGEVVQRSRNWKERCCILLKEIQLLFACVHALSLSRFRFFATPWTVARQTPLSMELSRQEYWNGLSFPSLGDLPNTGIKPTSPALAGRFFTTELPGKPNCSLVLRKDYFQNVNVTSFIFSPQSKLFHHQKLLTFYAGLL